MFAPEGEEFYFQNRDGLTFTGYYPYHEARYFVDGDATVRVTLPGECQMPEVQSDYDLLFAEAAGSSASPNVRLSFRHCLSRVVLRFLPGDGVQSLDDIEYTLDGLRLFGMFDTCTGATYMLADIPAAPLSLSVPGSNATELTSSLLIIPQHSDAKLTLSLIMRGTTHTAAFRLPENKDNDNVRELVAGCVYTYDVMINNTGMTLSPAAVADWTDGGSENIESQPGDN